MLQQALKRARTPGEKVHQTGLYIRRYYCKPVALFLPIQACFEIGANTLLHSSCLGHLYAICDPCRTSQPLLRVNTLLAPSQPFHLISESVCTLCACRLLCALHCREIPEACLHPSLCRLSHHITSSNLELPRMPMPDAQIHPVATGKAAETVKAASAPQDLVFYSG